METKIIISGAGGQGVIFAGVLTAQGAMEAGKHTTFFPSYGAEIRGGAALSSVIISDEPIGSPVVSAPDALLLLNGVSFVKYASRFRTPAAAVVNTSIVKDKLPEGFEGIPATDIAMDEIGDARTANVVMIGYYLRISGALPVAALKKACDAVSKNPHSAVLNKKALDAGYNYGEKKSK